MVVLAKSVERSIDYRGNTIWKPGDVVAMRQWPSSSLRLHSDWWGFVRGNPHMAEIYYVITEVTRENHPEIRDGLCYKHHLISKAFDLDLFGEIKGYVSNEPRQSFNPDFKTIGEPSSLSEEVTRRLVREVRRYMGQTFTMPLIEREE